MSGVSLPVIPGAAPRAGSGGGSQHGGSRPGSAASGNYTYVPQVYFSSEYIQLGKGEERGGGRKRERGRERETETVVGRDRKRGREIKTHFDCLCCPKTIFLRSLLLSFKLSHYIS